MENNGFIVILWILWIVTVIVQLVVAVKFFDMASDIKSMKRMMRQSLDLKLGEPVPADNSQMQEVNPKKFRWLTWMYIAIAVILLLIFILN